ncbi:MAG: beta-ketoacyl-ACP synthase III [Gammaproteobacteria bacterium]
MLSPSPSDNNGRYTRIISTGSYLPEKVLTNADLERMVSTSDAWITERTGIKRRHIAADDETSATMAAVAARRALEKINLDKNEIELIICATCTPDSFFPSTACLLQQKLGVQQKLPAFDVSAACAGFIYALSICDQFIRSGTIKTALVVGCEVMSRIIDWSDRKVCVLFGDGAGAVILQASDECGIISNHLYAQGQYKDLLYLNNSHTAAKKNNQSEYVHMQGHEVFKMAVNTLGAIVEEAIEKSDYEKKDIDWLVPHQANLRIIKAAAKKLNMPLERVILTVAEHGNTSAASIPLALDQGISDGRIQPGNLLLFEAFGGGLAWGSTLVRY